MAPVIRRVNVELLRRGPRHNQLLSPLTDYLAVCGDFPGGVVNVPYEQADVERLIDDLRYEVASAAGTDRLAGVRDRAGADLASMLAQVPGLAGVLAGEQADAGGLTHLRLVTSASELALLPFELAKVPAGAGGVGQGWLSLQPDRPLCLTRHVRGVAAADGWPTEPRILFVSADDVPFERHLDALLRVLEPWQTDQLVRASGGHRWDSQLLTVLERATLDEVAAAVATRAYTHVHVLAHGARVDSDRTVRHGLAIGGRVVTGGDLALALATRASGRAGLPSVVTLAACDSAAQGSVVMPGGSVAHDLHASGIPLVVASQFPISEDASVPFVEGLYEGQLAGEHPFVTICDVRRRLATQFPDEHAWASVVVYEALPADFPDRLVDLCYWQGRRAHDVALRRVEALCTTATERMAGVRRSDAPFPADFASPDPDVLVSLLAAVDAATARLPNDGPYAVEGEGLRGSGAKRTAEVAYWLAEAPDVTAERREELLERCFADLELALDHYSSTTRRLLSTTDGQPQRRATIHWVLGQVVLLQAMLGLDVDEDLRATARVTARLDLDDDDPSVRGWALVSQIEQALQELALHGPSASVAQEAVETARELLRAMGEDSDHVVASCRQMRRFATWWGEERFVAAERAVGIERRVDWRAPGSVVPTAQAVADVLSPARRTARRTATGVATPVPPASPQTAASQDRGARTRTAPAGARTGTFSVEMLPARNGDCLWISYGDGEQRHVLVDCGAVSVAELAAKKVTSVDEVELFVLTHIDADHISGAIPLFEDGDVGARVRDVWFNGWRQLRGFLGVAQGEAFSALLDRDDRPFLWNRTERADDPPPPIVTDGERPPSVELAGGLCLTVLSPTPDGLRRLARDWHAALTELDPQRAMLGRRARPTPPDDPSALDLAALAASGPTRDSSVANLSSIAVLAEWGGRAVLLTGDAHADVLAASIRGLQAARGRSGERLALDALKLSHHGSANATTAELLDVVDCRAYLVSTDGSRFFHPDREAIARVIVHGGPDAHLYFSQRSDLNELWEDAALQQRYGYSASYGDDDGLVVAL